MADIYYGPSETLTARPIEPAKRRQPPALSRDRRQEIAAENRVKQAALDAEIDAWLEESDKLSERLSEKYGKKADHYWTLMFSSGVKFRKSRKPNLYNAWSHHIAKQNNENDAGSSTNLLDLQKEHKDDYRKLTSEQKTLLITDLIEQRESQSKGRRLNQRGRMQDVNHIMEQVIGIILGAKARSGIDGFVCLFTNTALFRMAPKWFFTCEKIDTYLGHTIKGWDTNRIGAQAEAFAVAGCDYMKFLRTSKARADWLKAEIRRMINKMLVEITGNTKAVMSYINYERDIVLNYNIELIGWTAEKWANPSDLSNSVPPLQLLYAALEGGQCRFVRLSAAELDQRRNAYDEKVAAGLVPAWKKRKDAGMKRTQKDGKKRKVADSGSSDDEEGADDVGDGGGIPPASQRRRLEDPERDESQQRDENQQRDESQQRDENQQRDESQQLAHLGTNFDDLSSDEINASALRTIHAYLSSLQDNSNTTNPGT